MNIYTIAYRFGICVEILSSSNNTFGPHQIFEGQELLIPIEISNDDLNFRNQRLEYDLETIKKILIRRYYYWMNFKIYFSTV